MKYETIIIYSLMLPFMLAGIGLFVLIVHFYDDTYVIQRSDLYKGIGLGFALWLFETSTFRSILKKIKDRDKLHDEKSRT